ncbi:hypothetical protein KY495_18415 [Massilia sp. PAMC28688]|uniref:peptide chain release factor family protein n=1 Tax=Massilia sp. PAMC28688 TaxID=2861283 RepID=UPI001C6299B3|nr:peptide chain release factor-like protein [Massilia sp. PAMC28688]QYF92689.1 hypothetical protein KY495_18415 [Massilia sp. PAMC28688]
MGIFSIADNENFDPTVARIETFRVPVAAGFLLPKGLVNTKCCVRITHLPSGIMVECSEERNGHLNRDMAWKMLKNRLLQLS